MKEPLLARLTGEDLVLVLETGAEAFYSAVRGEALARMRTVQPGNKEAPAAPKKPGRRKFTPEQRVAQAARMKTYWAKKKRATKK